MKKLTAISLYTGAGGLDYGFEAAGFRTAVAIEMDERCIETLRANRKWPTIQGDINSIRTEEILRKAKLRCGQPDVLIGGPPCQPFSKSGFWATGSTKRLADPRASTLENYLRVLEETQPRVFLMENVEGLGFKGTEAYEKLTEAITLEKSWSRKAIQPYVLLFRGTTDFLARGGVLSIRQIDTVQSLMKDGEKAFGRDQEMQEALQGLRKALNS